VKAVIHPVKKLSGISLIERGDSKSKKAVSILANVRQNVGDKEIARVQSELRWRADDCEILEDHDVDGSGNVMFIEEEFEHGTFHVTSHGYKAKTATKVADSAVKNFRTYLNSDTVVCPRLAD